MWPTGSISAVRRSVYEVGGPNPESSSLKPAVFAKTAMADKPTKTAAHIGLGRIRRPLSLPKVQFVNGPVKNSVAASLTQTKGLRLIYWEWHLYVRIKIVESFYKAEQ